MRTNTHFKKILITGSNSFIGSSLIKWLNKFPEEYSIETLNLRNDNWKKSTFHKYDVIYHVAGIVHKKEKKNGEIYYKINRDLTFEIAKKAKNEGVSQFIFLSTMSIYGMNHGIIDTSTVPNPQSHYAKSKFQAENLILSLRNNNFKVVIVRPPMVYGIGCKGNYSKLSKLSNLLPLFPNYLNRRSMIYIDNLSQFIKIIIDNNESGLYFPQNEDYVCTAEMVKAIRRVNNKNIIMTNVFNDIIRLANFSLINKVFGDLIYSKNMSDYSFKYCTSDFEESITLTERRNQIGGS